MGWQDYRVQHEPILYGWKDGQGKHAFFGGRTKSTIWNINRDSQVKYKHPTQKPLALIEEALKNSSKEEDIILDPFGGSGSTLLACEKLNRKAMTIELDPKFCDVILQRWEDYTGKKAFKENGR
jgi:DNA modification methylase